MRISEAFLHKPLLIVYICAGDPTPEVTVDLAKRIARAGADIIELGLPHSDPIADGPTIQAAPQRAIAAGMNTDVYFETVAAMNVDIPKIFMGYYNMIYARGLDKFASDCAKSGISGLIVPDLPPEEAGPLREACISHGVDLIFLVAPNTPLDRMRMILDQTSGFVYLVARTGVTGARKDVLQDTKSLIARVPGDVPRAVGFGISTPAQAEEVIRAGADAAIVGSACVDLIAKGEIKRLEQLVRDMKGAICAVDKSKAPIVC
ncbi:Tryptophan synthase alpha chain [uncultured archaeon]|nr:Tryptophan synthase alpha chain [uncultured archaeon]